MSLYPSLEDMKVDRMYQAQFDSIMDERAAAKQGGSQNELPYPIAPHKGLYPSLTEYMGLELSTGVLAANMPENMPEELMVVPMFGRMVAPLSGDDSGLHRAHVTNGIGEMYLCKDKGKLGIRVQAVNNGIFVSVVMKDSPAAKAGLRFGDQLLEVEGKSVAGLSADTVHDLLKKAPEDRVYLVVRDRPLERTVTLHKDSSGRIGFSFQNGKIVKLVVDSSAARNGLLTDHQLLEINGQHVVGLKDKEITQIIADIPSIVTVTVIPSFLYEHMTKKIASSLFNSMDHSIW